MSVRKRGNTWQVDVVVEGKRVREAFATEAQAQAREVELNTHGGLTLGELREMTIARVWKGSKTERKVIDTSLLIVNMIGPDMRVSNITARTIDTFIENLETQRNANGTINRKLAILSKMLHFAKTREYITAVPHIQFKKAPKGRDRYFSDEEEAKMLALLKLWSKQAEHDLLVFLFDTGARCGEALGLEWRDVSFTHVTFRDTKNGTTRSVPMTARVKGLFVVRGSTGPFAGLKYIEFNKLWVRMRDHLGYAKDKEFVPHTCRHTCASRLLQRGARLEFVQKWLGHKTIGMTMRYAHFAPTSLDSMAALLEQQPTEKPRHLGVVEGGQS